MPFSPIPLIQQEATIPIRGGSDWYGTQPGVDWYATRPGTPVMPPSFYGYGGDAAGAAAMLGGGALVILAVVGALYYFSKSVKGRE